VQLRKSGESVDDYYKGKILTLITSLLPFDIIMLRSTIKITAPAIAEAIIALFGVPCSTPEIRRFMLIIHMMTGRNITLIKVFTFFLLDGVSIFIN